MCRFVAEPKRVPELFKPAGLPAALKGHAAALEARLDAEDLLAPAELKGAAWSTWLLGIGILMLVGSYKMLVAIEKGKTNVGGLIALFVLAMLVLAIVVGVRAGRRLSNRGRAYLSRTRLAFAGLRGTATRGPAAATGYDPSELLMVGLFGLATLKGTAYSPYAAMFPASTGSGGCGAAVGGCGGGCGGGGGECGGGGCGGGGCGGCGG